MVAALKGIFKNSSGFLQLFIVVVVFFVGTIFSTFLYFIFLFLKTGFSIPETIDAISHLLERSDCIREYQLFQVLGSFLFPAIVSSNLFSDDGKAYLHLKTETPSPVFLLTILSIVFAIPFLNLTVYYNEQVQLPEFMKGIETIFQQQEQQAKALMEMMLTTDNPLIIAINFLIVAVLAAIAEEFLFRGILLNIFRKKIKNHHVAIWVVAFIFSAIHFQFYGFIPRMLLGAYLGYLLYYTNNIWVPVLAHFTNNALSLLFYYTKDSHPSIGKFDSFGSGDTWPYAVASFSLGMFFFSLIVKQYRSKHLSS